MGYQTGKALITVTRDGQPVDWTVDMLSKTVTVAVAGQTLGTFGNRTAAKEALGLVDVPAKERK